MAKTSMIERETRRAKLVKQQAAKRARLKETIRSPKSTDAEREEAVRKFQALPRDGSASRMRNRCAITGRSRGVYRKFQALPRDGSASRMRNRCAITGRSRGVYRKFGLGRHKLREATMRGDVPGLRKASW